MADLKPPRDFAERLTDHDKWGNFVNNGGAISPDGERLVFLSDRTDYFDVWLLDIESGKLERLLRGERSQGFEQLKWLDSRISWSPDGKFVTFASKAGARDAMNILDVSRHKVTQRLRFDQLDGIFNPVWSPDGSKIAFVGVAAGQSDLYYYDLGEKQLTRITNDGFSCDDPSWSPDSRSLIFAADRGDSLRIRDYNPPVQMWKVDYHEMHLYRIQLGDTVCQRLTTSPFNERYPIYTPDGQYIIYASDDNGIYNLYRRNVATGETKAITNCLTGCTQPSYSLKTQRLTFTSLYHGGYDVYLIKNAPELPGITLQPTNFRMHGTPKPQTVSEKGAAADSGAAGVESQDNTRPYEHYVFNPTGQPSAETVKERAMADTATTRKPGGGFFNKKYKVHFTPDFVFATAAYSSFFGAQGSGQILFSDVLGDQMVYVNTDLYYDFQNLDNTNFSIQYFYLPRRINYGLGVFRYVYYLGASPDTTFQDQTWQIQGTAAYPLSKYTRFELDMNTYVINRAIWGGDLNQAFIPQSRRTVMAPELAYIHDTSIGNIISPTNGVRYRLSYSYSPPLGKNGLVDKPYADFYVLKGDYRQYFRLGRSLSLASRLTMGMSGGPQAQDFFVGGVSNWINRRFENDRIPSDIDNFYFSSLVTPFRGADYFQQSTTGHKFFLMNQELRFPFIENLQLHYPLPIQLRGVQGVSFLDVGGAWNGDKFKVSAVDSSITPVERRLAVPHVAYGLGLRAWLGFFVLRWDISWATDGIRSTKPLYFMSVGSGF